MTLAEYAGRFTGRGAVLCGGTTAAEQPLDRIRCPLLGVNKSYRLVEPARTFAHILSGLVSALTDSLTLFTLAPRLPVFSWRTPPGGGHRAPNVIVVPQVHSYTFDVSKGMRWVGAAPAALQLMVYLGFTEIVFVGLDLKRRGRHLKAWEQANEAASNTYDAERDYLTQGRALDDLATMLARQRPHVRVLNVSHDSACGAFERRSFDEVFA